MKKVLVTAALIMVSCFVLTGCFEGMPQQTKPPEQSFGSEEELTAAISKVKADDKLEDAENLKGLSRYYDLKTVPEGFKLNKIKVSSGVVLVEYANGPASDDNYDNSIRIGWYREANVSSFLSSLAESFTQNGLESKTFNIGDIKYLKVIPLSLVAITNSPGVTSAVTPAPTTRQVCQTLYWVQDGNAFVSFVPLSFTEEDIGKYCLGLKVDIK